MQNRKYFLIITILITLILLGACGENTDEHEHSDADSTDENLTGIMLAGKDLPEQVGLLKSVNNDEVIITIDNKDITYRLSEDAKIQLDSEQVESGSEVSFTTYTIGDEMETIDRFNVE